jgi:CBS domain containing-hemolysin-like protein
MTLLFAYLLLALVVSFICSIAEAVLLSTPMSFLKVREAGGQKSARLMIRQKQKIDQPLSAILTLNTIAHTVGAAGVGSEATKVFGATYFGLISAILTLLILVFTEIVPKTIGSRYFRYLSGVTANVIAFMIFLAYPFVIMAAFITKLITGNKNEQTTSREEISALADIGMDEGLLAEKENRIIQNLIRLKNIRVSEVMTPRVVVAAADDNLPLGEFQKNREYLRFSRIPVYSGNDEHITGYVIRQSVFENLADNREKLKLRDIKRDIIVVPNSKPLLSVWEKLLERKEHIALVVDEYGGVDGIVTMEDIIESLLGIEIVDEKDTITDMQQYARERWKMRQEKYRVIDNARNSPSSE